MKSQTQNIWAQYLAVKSAKGNGAAWAFAMKHFDRSSEDYKSAQRFHAPNAAQRTESKGRQAAISKVSQAEAKLHCQFQF
jgi:hypothetical protein